MVDGSAALAFLPFAVVLFLAAFGCGWLISKPSRGPNRNLMNRSWFSRWLWVNAKPVYVFFEKSLLLLGVLGFFAGALYFVKLAVEGR
jgi:hypothetical protein